jgi:glutamate-1-semialdehyde aminotransferase
MFERSSRYLPGGVAGVMASSHPLFISAAHTDQHVSEVLEAAKRVLTQMAE